MVLGGNSMLLPMFSQSSGGRPTHRFDNAIQGHMGLLDANFQAPHFAVVLQDVGGNVSGNSLDEVARLTLHHQPDVPARHSTG